MSHTRGGSVGEGQNVVRKSSKRSRLILGAAVASALAGMTASSVRAVNYTWNGTAGGPSFWDVNSNWSPNTGFPNSADNVVFGAGAVDFGVDLHATGQNVNAMSFTNATGSYNIFNGTLSIAGAVTQTGAATNTIAAPIIAAAPWTVSAGTLRVTNVSSNQNNFSGNTITVNAGGNLSAAGSNGTNGYTNAVNAANIALNGGTFTASSVLAGGSNQLLASWYDTAIDQGLGHKFDRLIPSATTSMDTGTGILNLVPNGYSPFARQAALSDQGQNVGPFPTTDVRNIADGAITNHGDFAMALTGNLTVSAADAGTWQFATNSDDGSVLYIDLNNNGVFDHTNDPSTNELIVSNNFDQGPTTRTNDATGGHPALNLAAGTYKIAFGWYEGRVTGSFIGAFNNNTVAANPSDPNTWRFVDPSDPAQSGMWSWTNTGGAAKYNGDYSTTNVSVTGSSNVVVDAVSAKFGNLTLNNGSTLNVSGNGPATFGATAATGTVTVNNSNRVRTGLISGAVTRINKQGAGALLVDDLSGASSLTTASTISVQNGSFTAKSDGTNSSIGGAKISLDGGTFVAQSSSGIYGFHNYYYAGPNAVSLIDPISNLIALTPSGENGITGALAWSDGSEVGDNISSLSGGVLGADNYSVLSRARLHISAANAGVYKFGSTSDDGTTMWIDLNHDGKFTYSTNPADNELIVNNNVYQGPTRRNNDDTGVIAGHLGHPNLTLAAGVYDVAFGMYEGGGGSEVTYYMTGPATGGAEVQIAGNIPGIPGAGTLQEGLWTATDGTLTDANFSASTVTVTADSTLDVFAPSASFGALTIPTGKTLTVTGLGTASFPQSSLAGTVGLNTVADVRTGKIINGGGLTTINKGGAGALILDDTTAASALTGAMTINATAGTVVGTRDATNNPLGGAVINLSDGAGILLSSKVGTAVTFGNTVSGTGNISVTAATRGNGAVDTGDVTLTTLNAAAGSTINVAANNGYTLRIGTTNMAGNATIVNNSSDTNIRLGNLSGAASSVINVNGANRTTVTGNITGNNVIINSPGVTFDPGAATTKTSTANTQVNTEMRIASGVIDYGQAVISGNPAHFVAGLYEGRLSNVGQPDRNINKVDANPNATITLGVNHVNQPNVNTDGGEVAGWVTDSTYIYSGQIFIPDNGTAGDGLGTVSFAEQFDDYTQVKIDGQLKIDDAAWDTPSTSGILQLSAGWHDIEMRFGQGVGGVGSAGGNGGGVGWPDGKAFGVAFPGVNSANGNDYQIPIDNGSMNLFRALAPVSGTVDIESGTELKAGGLTQLGAVNLNGQSGLAKLTLNNHATASNSDVLNLNLLGLATGEVNIGTNTTLTATNLNIDTSGSTFTKSGPGVLRVSGSANLQSPVIVAGGKMQFNGTSTGPGGADVQSGAAIGGTGTVSGNVTVESGGSISPHDGTGVATLTISDSLGMNPLSKLDFNFGNTGDSVNVLNTLTLSGNTTLNLNAITGFTVGTYRLFTMTAFVDGGDVVMGSNNGPAAFNYSIVETAPVGSDPGHIDLVVTTQTLKWTGATNNVWDINNTVNWQNAVPAPAKYIDLTAVVMDNTGNNRNINITATSVNPASVTVNNDATHAYSIGGNPIAGPTGILKQGVGDLTLTGSNTFIGPVTVEAGSVTVPALANGNVASPLGAGTLPITLGGASTAGTLSYTGGVAGSTDRGITLAAGGGTVNSGASGATFGGIVSGTGDLTKTGTGTLTLSGATNTNTGSINVQAGTLSVGSMGIGASPAVVNISSGATFDYAGPTQTGGRGVTTAGTGIFRVSNAATNLTLNGNVGGPTVNKAGPGTLTLGGVVSLTGTSHNLGANSGTLALTGTSGNTVNGTFGIDSGSTLRAAPGAIGTVAVSLNGGTLSLAGPTSQAGINGDFYQFGPFQAMLNSAAAFNAELANHQPPGASANTSTADLQPDPNLKGAINNNAGNGNPFSQYGVDIGADNIVGHWKGTINVDAAHAGLASFFTASDDGSVLWVDGVKVVDNNFFQGVTERSGNINLAEGAHTVEIGFYEGGGGAGMIWRWTPANGGKEVVPNAVLSSGSANWGNNVSTVAGTTSTINTSAAAVGNLGALNLGNGSTLRVTGGAAHFTGTTLAAAAGTYNVNGGWDANLGSVSGSGTINHSGIGSLILETNNTAGPGAGSVINMTGGTLGAVGDAGSTNPLGAAAVTLGDGSGILLGARSGDVTINSPVSASGNVRIGSGIVGSATAGPHTLTLGSAANPVNLAAGASVDFTANDGTSLVLPAVQQAGAASYSNSSLENRAYVVSQSDNIRLGNISAAGTSTFQGNRQISLTGNITGSGASVVVRSGGLNVDPGAAGTSNIAGPILVATTLNAKSGTLNAGNNLISGQTAVAVAGLNEYFANGGFYEGPIAGRPNTYNVPDTIQLEPRRANQAVGNTNGNPPGQGGNAPGWTDNSTYIYSGQILVPDNDVALDGMGHVAFGMRFDDSISLKIDGQTVMRDTNWDNSTSSGELVLSAGWHDIEMRFGEGGGGVGPNSTASGWPGTFPDGTPAAVGYQTDPTLGFDGNSAFDGSTGQHADITHYFAPRDNGTMNMFRIASQAESGTVNLASGATVNAGGLENLQQLNLAGNTHVNLSSTSAHSGTVVRTTATGAVGDANTINLSANNTLRTQQLVVAGGTIFNKDGAGTLRIEDVGAPTAAFLIAHDFGNDSEIHINAGKMIINSAGTSGTGSVFVSGGATLGGSGSITGAVAVSSTGHVAPGASVGTLTVGGLSLTSSMLDIEGGAVGLDQIKLSNDGSSDVFTLSGTNTINLFDLGGVAQGDYVIIDQNNLNPIANAASFFTISNPNGFAGLTASVQVDGNNDIVLHLAEGGVQPQWGVDANGNWSLAANWIGGVPNSPTAAANFLGKILAPRTVTVDSNQTVKDINFNNANKYTIAGGGGTLSVNGGTISVLTGSHEISAPLSLSGAVTKTGPGTLTISGAQSNAAGSSLTVNQGTVNLNSNAGGGTAASSPLALNINGSGGGSQKVTLGANQDLSNLTIAFGDANSQTLDLASPAGAGQFHQVQVYAANLAAAKTALYNALVNANAAGATDPTDGITDSGLHSGAKIGLALLGDHVTIRPVRVGDLNLDGTVTISDFIDLASNFNTIGTATWQEGDLNYDRNVTISDFIDLASNFNGSYAGGAGAINSEDVQTLASFAQSIGVDPSIIGSAVPEPGTLSLLAIGAMGLMSRRRRKA